MKPLGRARPPIRRLARPIRGAVFPSPKDQSAYRGCPAASFTAGAPIHKKINSGQPEFIHTERREAEAGAVFPRGPAPARRCGAAGSSGCSAQLHTRGGHDQARVSALGAREPSRRTQGSDNHQHFGSALFSRVPRSFPEPDLVDLLFPFYKCRKRKFCEGGSDWPEPVIQTCVRFGVGEVSSSRASSPWRELSDTKGYTVGIQYMSAGWESRLPQLLCSCCVTHFLVTAAEPSGSRMATFSKQSVFPSQSPY